MKRLVCLTVLFCLLVGAVASADEMKMGNPKKLGLSGERMGRIDAMLERNIAEGKAVGAVGVIARHGKIAYLKAFGQQDCDNGPAMGEDTIFRVYSMTKPLTAVGLMMLYEQGLFRLEDPVWWYLPEFKDMKVAVEETDAKTGEKVFTTVPAERAITVRDLLRHTSGIGYGAPPETTLGKMYEEAKLFDPSCTLAEIVKKLSELPLMYHPGKYYEYGFSIDVAGRLIEVLSGKPYDVYMKEHLFDPLGMMDTGFYVPAEKMARFAGLYCMKENKLEAVPVGEKIAWDFTKPPTMLSPGGGAVSTARDYLKFAQMLLNKGEFNGVQFLSPKTIQLMTEDHLGDIARPWWAPKELGLVFSIEKEPGTEGKLGSKGTFGWSGAASTQCWVDPSEDMVTLFMVQVLGDCYLPELFKITAYQTIVK